MNMEPVYFDTETLRSDGETLPLLTHHNETETSRVDRLLCVVGYLCAHGLHTRIRQLHDHKGDLTVTWWSEPTTWEEAIVVAAWASDVGDGYGNVTHEVWLQERQQ